MKSAVARWGGLLAAAGFGIFLIFALRVPQGFAQLSRKHEEIRQLQRSNADLSRENAMKRDRINKLRGNRSEQELEIRERLKKLRQGETSFIIPEQPQPKN
jgi:cell division protein FtsB